MWLLRDTRLGQGLGPLGPGAPGPTLQDTHGKCTTYCQAGYLLSGKANYCQACTQPLHRLAANNRRHAPKRFRIHAPNNRILCTQPLHRDAPKRRILCTQKSPHTCTQFPRILYFLKNRNMVQDLSRSVPMVSRSPGYPPK